MDLSCIITSGDLELFVLGMLPAEETAQIEQLALLFPEVREELDRISAALLELAQSASVEPSVAAKKNLMAQIDALHTTEAAATAPVVPIQTGRYNPVAETENGNTAEAPVVSVRNSFRHRTNLLAAASFIGVLLSLGAVIFLADKNRQNRSQISTLQQNLRSLNRNVVELQRDNLAAYQMVNMLQDDVYRKIKLTAVPGKPAALVQVMWNSQTKEVFVNNISLPGTPAGKQYQLWAIVDGKPVDAGMLRNEKNRVQQMKNFERADAFAITLENEGGSATPTMEQMFVMGGA